MNWRRWFGRQSQSSPPQMLPSLLEGGPIFLVQHWMLMVTHHYGALEECAQQVGISITEKQSAQLFIQVCLFYDALWYFLLTQRILETNTIPHDQATEYVTELRNLAMSTLANDETLPESWRDWRIFESAEETQVDSDFYLKGILPKDWEDEYNKILNLSGCKRDGTTLELTSRLYLRTFQILGLLGKRELLHILVFLNRQSFQVQGYITNVLSKIVPLPS